MIESVGVTPDDLEPHLLRLRQELRADIQASIAEDRRATEAQIAASREEARRYTDAQIAASREEARRYTEQMVAAMRQETDEQTAENRRLYQVLGESLISRIQLVAEGVATVDGKLDEFREEVRGNFARVDRRLLRLEVRVSVLECMRRFGSAPFASSSRMNSR